MNRNKANNAQKTAKSTQQFSAIAPVRVDVEAKFRPTMMHFWLLIAVFVVGLMQAHAQTAPEQASVIEVLTNRFPLLLKAFVFNIMISFMAMALGTVVGMVLGVLQISLIPPVRVSSWFITQFFRNAPWLVLLFFVMFLIPFEFTIFGVTIPFPDWIKSVIGLSLPVMANVSEIVRGAIGSIPKGQWEASEALAFTRFQQLTSIILPQCYKRMLPPWMNLYAILTMATTLASIVGVNEVMTVTGQVAAAEGDRSDLLAPLYTLVMLLFFVYCYPIAKFTARLERRFAVH